MAALRVWSKSTKVWAGQRRLQFLAGGDLSRLFEKLQRKLKRLFLQLHFPTLAAQFAGPQIELEQSEAARVLAVGCVGIPHSLGY